MGEVRQHIPCVLKDITYNGIMICTTVYTYNMYIYTYVYSLGAFGMKGGGVGYGAVECRFYSAN